jgi:proteic killer suppression protein
VAIQPFSDKVTEEFFVTGSLPKRVKWRLVAKIVRRKLDVLNYSALLIDLRSPPGNRLEALKGDWLGYYSIRVNDQWRIVFQWTDRGPENVAVVDYHS